MDADVGAFNSAHKMSNLWRDGLVPARLGDVMAANSASPFPALHLSFDYKRTALEGCRCAFSGNKIIALCFVTLEL